MNPSPTAPAAQATRLPLAGYVLDLGCEELRDAQDRPVELRPQAWRVLRHLALNAGRLVSKEELLGAVWPDLVVTDDSLVQAIGDVRRALGDEAHRIVKTLPRRGYLLVSDALGPPAAGAAADPASGTTAAPASGVAAGPSSPVSPQLAPRRSPGPAWRRHAATAAIGAVSLAAAGWLLRAPPPEPVAATAPAPASPQAMPDRPSIAVLPFKDPQRDPAGELVARGVAEDLVGELARNADLRIVSRFSSFSFAGRDAPLAEIGERLRSRYLVDGTVRRDGELLRIAVELIDSQEGHVVWSAQHTVDSLNVLATRDALVRRIAGSVHSTVRHTEERAALSRPPKNLDVYAMTLRSIALKHRFTAEATREARALLDQAIAIDPGYAPAWVYLAYINGVDALYRYTGEWHPGRAAEIREQAERAVALDGRLPAAYQALALAHLLGRNMEASLAASGRCVELGPNDAECWMFLSMNQLSVGQTQPSLQSIERAVEVSPVPPPWILGHQAGALWANRRLDEAIRASDEALAKAPGFGTARRYRMLALVEAGRLDEARQDAAALLAQAPDMRADRVTTFPFSDPELRQRIRTAALAAGIPPAPNGTCVRAAGHRLPLAGFLRVSPQRPIATWKPPPTPPSDSCSQWRAAFARHRWVAFGPAPSPAVFAPRRPAERRTATGTGRSSCAPR